MALNLPPCPQSLKSIQHYLKTASEHDQRDVVVAYWCRLYALQTALKIDKKSEDARTLLVALMDWLEQIKKTHAENDAIINEVAAQAHLENYALKLFTWADTEDRAGRFNKNVIKAFYTAGMLMDVLTTFGEQTEEIARNCKYAKWKAAYIHNCLKNGETPIAGPMESQDDVAFNDNSDNMTSNIGFQTPNSNFTAADESANPTPAFRADTFPSPIVHPAPPSNPTVTPGTPSYFTPAPSQQVNSSGKVDPSIITKAQKYCKFAGSALNYDDIPEAIKNLEKALHLLRTGEDS